MTRRKVLVTAAALTVAPWVRAQQVPQYRIGWIATSANTFREPYSLSFAQRLTELGFVEGKNLSIERRHADNRVQNFPKVATAMAANRYDLVFTGGPAIPEMGAATPWGTKIRTTRADVTASEIASAGTVK